MNAYRLAICEDNDTIRAQLHSLCREVLNEIGVEHSIMDFSSAQELENLLEAENNPFALLLLDIRWRVCPVWNWRSPYAGAATG